jgi:hypothetical protein
MSFVLNYIAIFKGLSSFFINYIAHDRILITKARV